MNDFRFPDKMGSIFTKIINAEIPQGISLINSPAVWQYTKGEGVVVAVIDTGIDLNHPDLKDNIIDAVSLIDNDPQDGHGHGTHVAGTIAGKENNLGVVGVAPLSKILSVKVIPSSGQGNNLPIPEGIEYAVNWRGKNGERVRIINMSLATANSAKLYNAIKKAVDSGIIVCCASGNEGDSNADTDELAYPAMYQESVEVGAWDISGKIAEFSNSNYQLDLIALGVNVHSCYLQGQYATWSGTSMATPHVAGACALLISGLEKVMKRKLTEWEIYHSLIKRTRDLGLNQKLQGHGLLDLSLYINEFINGIGATPKEQEYYSVIISGSQFYVYTSQIEAEDKLRSLVVNSGWNVGGHIERMSDRQNVFSFSSANKKTINSTILTGKSITTAEKMEMSLRNIVPDAPYLANLYLQEGSIEGIRGDLAFAQAVRDTLFFLFENDDHDAGQHNYGRLGKNPKNVSFPDARTGVRSHIQHIKAGANKEPLKNTCVDPFFNEIVRGSRPTLESLSGTWHVPGYNRNIYQSLAQAIQAKDAYHNWIIQRYEKIINTFVPSGYIAPNPYPIQEKEGEIKVENGILIYSNDDFPTATRLSARLNYCPIFIRKDDKTAPADIINVKKLFIVGGSSVGHPNEVLLTGANWFMSNYKVGKYLRLI